MRVACIYRPSMTIMEVRQPTVWPTYIPEDSEWVDIEDDAAAADLTDVELVGMTWDGSKVVVPPVQKPGPPLPTQPPPPPPPLQTE